MMWKDDAELVRQCSLRNGRSFEDLAEKYQKPVFNIAYRMTNDLSDSESITQSVFNRVVKELPSFNRNFKFVWWIYRIAVNESLHYLNHKKSADGLNTFSLPFESTPEDVVYEQDVNKIVQNALMLVDQEYRILIVLNHFLKCSYEEIAYIMDISEIRVKSELFTARQITKSILAADEVVGYD